jgi:hypothetical protein
MKLCTDKFGKLDPYYEIISSLMPPMFYDPADYSYGNTSLYNVVTSFIEELVGDRDTFGIETAHSLSQKQAKRVLGTIRALFTLVDDEFWTKFCAPPRGLARLGYPPDIRPLYEIYQRLSTVLERNFGIMNIQFGPAVKKELDEGPERERLRREKRAKREAMKRK